MNESFPPSLSVTRGYVDSASLHGVIAALSYPSINQWPNWTIQSAVEITSTLINDPIFEIAPGPSSYAGDYGLMDHTMCNLAAVVSHSSPNKTLLLNAQNRVKMWLLKIIISKLLAIYCYVYQAKTILALET